ncbi:MAG TPA: TlpA disulfide reductase family protein [Tepidisphaeraceae bacterium]|nr:TlpA disulfide reductase family protein [Tepidisphaeraceae bacterium]
MASQIWIRTVASLTLALGAAVSFGDQPATSPPASKTTTATTAPAISISPEAKKLIDQVTSSYAKLNSLQLKGTFHTLIDAQQQKTDSTLKFEASFAMPNKFRHTMQDDVLCGSTGTHAYAYNQSRNTYQMVEAPRDKASVADLPEFLSGILSKQNPALLLAAVADPGKVLSSDATEMTVADPTHIGSALCPTLQIKLSDKSETLMAFDPDTHFVRQVIFDLKTRTEQRGVPNVKKALVTVDYAETIPDRPLKDEQFAWTPPAGAKDAIKMAEDEVGAETLAMVGKPAPNFKLAGLDGKTLALSDFHGKVVLLDFWATWCGPCKLELPHLQEIYEARKAQGLVAFALEQGDEKELVQKFVDKTKLTIPVLLDAKGDASDAFKVAGLPTTILIAKNGKIRNAWPGIADSTEIAKAVDQALHE